MNDAGGLARYMPFLVLGVFVVIALGLMLAGYGAPVAAGVLAGLVVGAAVGGIIGSWLLARARASSEGVAFGWGADSGGPPPELLAFTTAMSGLQRVDQGDVTRIVPGGQSSVVNGIRVELIALELRTTGGIAHLAAAVAPPAAMIGAFAEASVSDDLGTQYTAVGEGGSSSIDRHRVDIRFAPTPPDATRMLTVRVDSFADPFPPPHARKIAGPWVLTVDLAS
jgi:hypothetical protein